VDQVDPKLESLGDGLGADRAVDLDWNHLSTYRLIAHTYSSADSGRTLYPRTEKCRLVLNSPYFDTVLCEPTA
jgi:hypothetical protein